MIWFCRTHCRGRIQSCRRILAPQQLIKFCSKWGPWRTAENNTQQENGYISYITFWVGKDFKGHPVPIPCCEQGFLPLDEAAQSPIQPSPGHLQGWGNHNFSEQTVPLHLHSKEFLPSIWCKSTFFLFKNITLVLSPLSLTKNIFSSFL